jgi:hypothetical protein
MPRYSAAFDRKYGKGAASPVAGVEAFVGQDGRQQELEGSNF